MTRKKSKYTYLIYGITHEHFHIAEQILILAAAFLKLCDA